LVPSKFSSVVKICAGEIVVAAQSRKMAQAIFQPLSFPKVPRLETDVEVNRTLICRVMAILHTSFGPPGEI
jgi:hypothetical protein